MDMCYFIVVFLMYLWSYPVTATRRQVCQQRGPLRCQNGGVLYIRSVHCRPYGYAMQLLQEMCSGLTECQSDVIRDFLQPRCCGQHEEDPFIIYQCTSGTGEEIPETSHPDRGDTGEVVSTVPGGHSVQDHMVIVAVFTGVVFLWGVGLIFFHLRYNSTQCSWFSRRHRTKHSQSGLTEDNPVYIPPNPMDQGHYVEIEALPSTHVYSNVIIPSAPPFTLPYPLPD